MLSIGEFSKVCSVTTKTLRYYDEIGLIKPVHTNRETGYRYYDVSQLETMLTISKLKRYELSLEQICEIVHDESGEKLLPAIVRQEKKLRQKQDSYDFLLASLEKDIKKIKQGEGIMSHLQELGVQIVEKAPMNILASRQVMSVEEFGKYTGQLFARIAQERLTMTPDAPMLTFYHDEEFDPAASDMELAIPIEEKVGGTRVVPAQRCAMIRHVGPYSELPGAYAKITAWMQTEGYAIAGPPYDAYLTNPADTKPEDNITEIYFPIRRR